MNGTAPATSHVRLWHLFEHLEPFDVRGAVLGFPDYRRDYVRPDEARAPWEYPAEVLAEQYHLREHEQYYYRVYLGLFDVRQVNARLREAFPGEDIEAEDSPLVSCCAAVHVKDDGEVLPFSLSISSMPWTVGNILQKQLQFERALDWVTAFREYEAAARKRLYAYCERVKADGRVVSLTDLRLVTSRILAELYPTLRLGAWQEGNTSDMAFVIARQPKATDEEFEQRAADIMGSFYLPTLEALVNKAITPSAPLAAYLAGQVAERTDIRSETALRARCTPRALKTGHWPNGQIPALMQQVAVNEILGSTRPLVAVNGPPGTGKTSLIKLIAAHLVTERAERMVAFDNPCKAITVHRDSPILDPALCGFELLVASNNNEALRNVAHEFPKRSTIPNGVAAPSYFSHFATEAVQDEAWGLVAAELGSRANCNRLATRIWFGANAKSRTLQHELSMRATGNAWTDAVSAFGAAKARVRELVDRAVAADEAWRNGDAIEHYRAQFGEALGDSAWWSRDAHERDLFAPWITEELVIARTELFAAALQVHEAFVRANADHFRPALAAWLAVVTGQDTERGSEERLALWRLAFVLIPILTTTFASVPRLLDRLPKEAFGWAYIDEAGQSTPQAAVGVLQHVRRAIVVGDPAQVAPVVTLDSGVIARITEALHGDLSWMPGQTSAQEIADRACDVGTVINGSWVGIPLTVHRRCLEPMFSLANALSYDGIMTQATHYDTIPAEMTSWGGSMFHHVPGSLNGRHYVPAQGQYLQRMLQWFVTTHRRLPRVFIITPFREVAAGLKTLLRNPAWAANANVEPSELKRWVERSVGTIHTFQGKEQDAVICVLGCGQVTKRSAEIVARTKNVLNVTLTRPRFACHLIGDGNVWGDLPNFGPVIHYLTPRLSA